MENVKHILSNFDNNSAAQLKYYLITCLFPEQNDSVIKEIGGFNPKTYGIIKNKVIEKGLPLLKFGDSEELDSLYAELEDQQRALLEAAEEIQNLTKKDDAVLVKVKELQEELAQTKGELASLKAGHAFADELLKNLQKKYAEEISMNHIFSVGNQYYRFLLEKNGIAIDREVLSALESDEMTMDELRKKSKSPKLVKF